MNRVIKKVTEDIERFHFNTAIAALMEFTNLLQGWDRDSEVRSQKSGVRGQGTGVREQRTRQIPIPRSPTPDLQLWQEALNTLVVLLSPFTPHVCEELWERLGNEEMVIKTPWPVYSEEALKREEVLVVVQINGKVRSRINVSVDASQKEVEDVAFNNERVKDWIKGKAVKKVVYVPNRIINVVVE
ncbi:MAG: class I tRNA ligase family protein [Deltaproteobacteria bacterium]|nr:class I tRNA ligase family protein [Deltaproteobacteria bacterium]